MELEGHAHVQEGETISTRTICEQEVHYRFVSTEEDTRAMEDRLGAVEEKQHELNSEPVSGK